MRDRRVPPGKDTKVLDLVERPDDRPAGRGRRGSSSDARYLEAAGKAAGFLLDRMRTRRRPAAAHATRTARRSSTRYLDDYANLIDGLTRLFEATGEPRWIEAALELARVMIDEFRDPEHGGFFYTGQSHEALIARQKDAYDNATPSGNAMAATALLRLGALTGRDDLTAGRPIGARVGAARAGAGPDGGRPEPDRARLPAGPDPASSP